MEIIKSYSTRGLCSTCYMELPATIEYRSDGAAYIIKTCPAHGHEEFMVERSYEYWDNAPQRNPNNPTTIGYNQLVCIDITDRCNVMCKHCYHNPDNKIKDKPKEFIINKIVSAPFDKVCLMGAEPTMREDLCEIISESKAISNKMIGIYSNGIKLAEPGYVEKLEQAGLETINLSVHNPEYHKEQLWQRIQTGVELVVNNTNLGLGQISFTVENLDEVRYAVEKMLWFKERNRVPGNFCIRSAAEIGTSIDEEEVFASEIADWISKIAEEKQLSFERHPNGGSNPYHIAYLLDGMIVQVIHWAGVKNVDLSWMNMGPWADFVPVTLATLHLQIILREGWKRGWWQGQRLVPPSKNIEIIKH